jgi:hypothetical protein
VFEQPAVQCVLINAVMDARVVEHDHSRTAIALADQRVEKFDDIRLTPKVKSLFHSHRFPAAVIR